MSAYLNHVRADVWIGQKGAYDLFQTLSLLPAEGEDLLREADGVKKVSPFVGRLMTIEVRTETAQLYRRCRRFRQWTRRACERIGCIA